MHLQVDRFTSKLHMTADQQKTRRITPNLWFVPLPRNKRKHTTNVCCVGYGIELEECDYPIVSRQLLLIANV